MRYRRCDWFNFDGSGVVINYDCLTVDIWNHDLGKVSKFTGNIKKDQFARQLKLKFHRVKNWRKNFDVFL